MKTQSQLHQHLLKSSVEAIRVFRANVSRMIKQTIKYMQMTSCLVGGGRM